VSSSADHAADRQSASCGTYSTSTSLLERARAQDAAAWANLVRVYGRLIYGWARRGGLGAEDAADIVQEVFRSVAISLPAFQPRSGSSFRGWLKTVTRSKMADHFRRRAGRPLAAGGTAALERLHSAPDHLQDDESSEADEATESQHVARRALELLQTEFEERTFRACWLTAVEGRATGEVAAELGMNAASVYQARSRIFRRLRELLEGLGEV
jgi:RNA polymerase sigma-70 factor (ECF subfamily)